MIHAILSIFVFYQLFLSTTLEVHPASYFQQASATEGPIIPSDSGFTRYAKLEGIVQRQSTDTLQDILLMMPTYAAMDPIEQSVPLDEKGRFSVSIPIPEGVREVYVMAGRGFFRSLWVENGVTMEVNLKDPQSVQFSGADAELNNAYTAYIERMEELHIPIPDSIKENISMTLPLLTAEWMKRSSSDSAYFNKNPSPLEPLMHEQRKSSYYAQLLSLVWPKNKVLPDGLEKEIFAYYTKHTTLSNTIFYYQLHTYIKRSHVFPRYVKDGKPQLTEAEWATIYAYKNNETKVIADLEQRSSYYSDELMLFLFLKMEEFAASHFTGRTYERVLLPVNVANEKQFLLIYNHLFQQFQTPFYTEVVSNRVQKALPLLAQMTDKLERLQPVDTPVPFGTLRYETTFGASLYVVDQKHEKGLIELLEKEWKDSALLFDFWAVWCVPCIQAMPHSKQLQNELAELTFIYVCTSNSSSEENWIKKVLELEQPGIHLFVHEDQVNRWMRSWELEGFPSVAIYQPESQKPIELGNFQQWSAPEVRKEMKP
jgi:thiol-disulfide isomerase/thioredoxin